MVLLIGGAYQGKLDLARKKYGLTDTEVYHCTQAQIDFTKSCIYGLEEFTLACVRERRDPVRYLTAHEGQWENSVFICRDIFCGVVPMGAENRVWRQTTGRLCQYLSGKAAQVSRVFCGLEQRLK